MSMAETISGMRARAHEVAVRRHEEWWNSLTPAQQKQAIGERGNLQQFKPGVIVLDTNAKLPTPYSVQTQLMMIDVFVPLDELAERSREDLEAATLWGTTVMLEASDNDVIIAPRPEWLPARDHAMDVPALVEADVAAHGGEEAVQKRYDADYKPTITVNEAMDCEEDPHLSRDYSHEPQWAQQMRTIGDMLLNPTPFHAADLLEMGEWLHAWLDAGAPMLYTAEEAEQDPTDTRVGRENSERSTDGNATTADRTD